MTCGYMGKILRVDLSDRKTRIEELPEAIYEKFLGGVCLGVKLLLEEVQPGINWFSPENRLILMTGPLSATRVSGSGTFCALSKGPMTEMGGSSQANGFFGAYLRFSGYDGLLIQGKASSPIYLFIDENGVEFRDASHLAGKGTSETSLSASGWTLSINISTGATHHRRKARPGHEETYDTHRPRRGHVLAARSVDARWRYAFFEGLE